MIDMRDNRKIPNKALIDQVHFQCPVEGRVCRRMPLPVGTGVFGLEFYLAPHLLAHISITGMQSTVEIIVKLMPNEPGLFNAA